MAVCSRPKDGLKKQDVKDINGAISSKKNKFASDVQGSQREVVHKNSPVWISKVVFKSSLNAPHNNSQSDEGAFSRREFLFPNTP